MRKTLYSQSVPVRTICDWYGDDVGDLVLAVTDIVRRDVAPRVPGAKFFYETNLIESVDVDCTKRLLSNRVKGCPSFYPMKSVEFSVNVTGGFLEYDLPDATRDIIGNPDLILTTQLSSNADWDMVQADRPHNSVAYVYPEYNPAFEIDDETWSVIHHAFSMREEYAYRVFGKAALEYANVVDSAVQNTMVYWVPAKYMRGYHAYFVTMYENAAQFFDAQNAPVYRGLIYTNLLRGCPVFFPNAMGQAYLNVQHTANNAVNPLILTRDAQNEIQEITHDSGIINVVW